MLDDKDYYWDWLKHEDNLFTSRGNFFLLGEAILVAAVTTLFSLSSDDLLSLLIPLSIGGVFITGIWIFANLKHVIATEPLIKAKLHEADLRRLEVDEMRKKWPQNHFIIGIFLPAGFLVLWLAWSIIWVSEKGVFGVLNQAQEGGMDMTTIVMAIATIVMAIATVFIAVSNRLSNRVLKSQSMPILNFAVDRKEPPAWVIKNVGKGTALNVLVAHKNRNGEIEEPIRDYNALCPGDCFRLIWARTPNILIAQFQDIYEHKYTVECGSSINRFYEEQLYNDWGQKPKRQFWQMITNNEVTVCGDLETEKELNRETSISG